ncbi:MAG: hypothetical protein V7744_08895 [Pseudomonadales bacterium]
MRDIYFCFNPEAKKAHIERKEKEAEQARKHEAMEEARKKREEAENRQREIERKQHRDADVQQSPYDYEIGRHGNESLAIRYGIANLERKVKKYWYYAKGGVRKRNPERDQVYNEPANTIRLQKTQKLAKDRYEVILSDHRDRTAIATIEVGTEYVKTFYPLEDSWFKEHDDLETTLKGNGTFSLKELATFHVQKTVGK